MTPVQRLAQVSEPAAAAFQALRKSAVASGPLDEHTCELIVLGALATTGDEASFKVHARRLLQDGVAAAAIRQAVLVTFGASTTFSRVSAALAWVDDLVPIAK